MGENIFWKLLKKLKNFQTSEVFLHNLFIDSESPFEDLSNDICENTGQFLVFAQWAKIFFGNF